MFSTTYGKTYVWVEKDAFRVLICPQIEETECKLAWGVYVHSVSLAVFDLLTGKLISSKENISGSVWHFLVKVNDEFFSLSVLIKAGHLSERCDLARAKTPFDSGVSL